MSEFLISNVLYYHIVSVIINKPNLTKPNNDKFRISNGYCNLSIIYFNDVKDVVHNIYADKYQY